MRWSRADEEKERARKAAPPYRPDESIFDYKPQQTKRHRNDFK